MEIIQNDFHKGRQSIELHRIVKVGNACFRVIIDRDSYDFQSKGLVQIGTPTGWSEIVTRDIRYLRSAAFSYGMQDIEPARESFYADADDLVKMALKVVGLDDINA